MRSACESDRLRFGPHQARRANPEGAMWLSGKAPGVAPGCVEGLAAVPGRNGFKNEKSSQINQHSTENS